MTPEQITAAKQYLRQLRDALRVRDVSSHEIREGMREHGLLTCDMSDLYCWVEEARDEVTPKE